MGMREKLIELLNQGADNTPCTEECWDKKCNDCIREAQADHLIANDVVPVVRCKDCVYGKLDKAAYYHDVYGNENDTTLYHCLYGFGHNKGEHFCSYGERKDNG